MERDKIGAIIKKRMHEKGLTQQELADKANISLASLKKYIGGKVVYNYEVLDSLASALECSYDYLLGKSKSPQREYHEVTEQTHLSEEAIANIFNWAKYYDEEFEARRCIMSLDLLLREKNALTSICDYLISSKYVDNLEGYLIDAMNKQYATMPTAQKLNFQLEKQMTLEKQNMISLVISLKDLKDKLTPEFIAELRKLDTEENFIKSLMFQFDHNK